ncbi:MarC family protein [Gleimia hominis]|uniref:MarC family protein n=1 Tax=Gleimia hominis TaxID=595468 RepID=UPI000C80DFB5|nr:MarC family protein [Gleimia hominis]WIK64734.1 MarC family protein [Gleimia hominis]
MTQWFDTFVFLTTFTTLVVIMDPAGNLPIFLSLTRHYDRPRKKRASMQATITSLVVIVVFAVFGQYILTFLHISVEALKLSGGVLLFIVAMELLTTNQEDSVEADSIDSNVALVPLGTPLMAGPGTIVAVMVAVNESQGSFGKTFAVAIAVFAVHLLIWLCFRFSVFLADFLGNGGILLLTKIAGLLLAAIATQMVADAVFDFIRENPIS